MPRLRAKFHRLLPAWSMLFCLTLGQLSAEIVGWLSWEVSSRQDIGWAKVWYWLLGPLVGGALISCIILLRPRYQPRTGLFSAVPTGGRSRSSVSLGVPLLLLIVGLVSRLIAAPITYGNQLADELDGGVSSERLIVGRVLTRPRHPRPYEVTFGLVGLARNAGVALGVNNRVRRSTSQGANGSQEHVQPQEGGLLESGRFSCRGVYLPWRNISGLRRGDVVALRVRATQITPEQPFSSAAYLQRRGYAFRCRVIHSARLATEPPGVVELIGERLHSYCVSALGEGERSGMLLALTLGERDGISLQTEHLFQQAGLSHILVLSGFQVSLIFALGMRLIGFLQRWLGTSLTLLLPHLIALGASLLLVIVSGFETSGARALLAVLLVAIREARGQERAMHVLHRLNSVGVVGCLMVIIWPGCLFEPGVELTFAALVVLIGSPIIVRASGLREFFLVTSLVSTVTGVIAGVWFGSLPLLGVPANLVVAPVFSYVGTLGGLLSLGLVAIGVDSGGVALRLIAAILELLRDVVALVVIWVASSSALYYALLLGHLLLVAIIIRLTIRQFRIVRALLLGVGIRPESFVG